MVGSIQDIDERIRAQQRLERANEDLEHFAHVAAHDLREPARRQRMLINFILEDHGDGLPEEARRDLERVREQSDAMLAMITGFRFLSGFDGATLDRREVELDTLAKQLVDEALEGKDAAVNISLPPTVVGYEALIEILLRNLISNAVKHGSRPLTLDLGHEVRTDGLTWFTVANSWRGDPRRVGQGIFKPFVSSDSTVGSGLGLSICNRVIQHHQGQIVVEPEMGVFKIAFNLGEAQWSS